MVRVTPLDVARIRVTDAFWRPRQEMVRQGMLRYQWKVLNDSVPGAEPSHALANFRIAAGEAAGAFEGYVFQDSDVYKWLEAVGHTLSHTPDPELEAWGKEVVGLLERVQQPDGYLDTYYILNGLDRRWTNLRDNHELYCAGHLFEAAVAFHRATGDPRILNVARRLADHLAGVFGAEPEKLAGYPGHPEVEMALMTLYRYTGEPRYRDLARFFIDERGRSPGYFAIEAEKRGETGRGYDARYAQADRPLRDQTTVEGHAVRAGYLIAGATDVALETGDADLLAVSRRLWDNMVAHRMYVTGGIGSQAANEGFTADDDLPGDRAYTETCAAVSVVMLAHRLLQAEPDAAYGDVMERALFNGVLAGADLEGRRYFYVNPLAVWPPASDRRADARHVKPRRQAWFACACCPPNLARLVASLGGYIYGESGDTLYVHLYVGSEATWRVGDQMVRIVQDSGLPWDGRVVIRLNLDRPTTLGLAFRRPGWADGLSATVGGEPLNEERDIEWRSGYGYLSRVWRPGDALTLEWAMAPMVVQAPPSVPDLAGQAAVVRGPLVYCAESVDNGPQLWNLLLDCRRPPVLAGAADGLAGIPGLDASGWRVSGVEAASTPASITERYGAMRPTTDPAFIRLVPYFAWANRDEGEMRVWLSAAHEAGA